MGSKPWERMPSATVKTVSVIQSRQLVGFVVPAKHIPALLARARKAKRRLLVFGLSPHYQEIFQITRLADFMTVFQDEASALAGGR